MVRCQVACTFAFVLAAPWSVGAQPVAPDVDSPYRITLRNVAPFVPDRGVLLDLSRLAPNDDSVHVLVQLDVDEVERARTQPEAEARFNRLFDEKRVITTLQLHRNVQRATYEGVIPRNVAERLNADGLAALDADSAAFVRWIGLMPREAKLEAALLSGQYQPWGLGPNDTFNLLVTFYADAVGEAEAVLGRVGVEPMPVPYTADTWRVVLRRDRLDALVAEDSVRSVAMGPKPFTALNNLTRTAVNVETVQGADLMPDPPTYEGLTGAGITVAVMDVGITDDHDDFWEHDDDGERTVSRVEHHTTTTPLSLHGTHIAGIIAGSGYQSARHNANGVLNSNKPYLWRGMAPRAKILSFADVNSGGDVPTQYQATVLGGADISNDSHEQEECLIYDKVAATVDGLVRGTEIDPGTGDIIPRRAAIWGAGNNGKAKRPNGCQNYGYFGLTVGAKNPIVVGATYLDNDFLWRYSSLGPTYDGRIKPDVVAPGCALGSSPVGIKSTAMPDPGFMDAVANGYDFNCGTSMATAVVSGIAALLLEKWREELVSTGSCGLTSGGACFPLPSTLKALLIQGAKDRDAVLPYPNSNLYLNPDTKALLQYHKGPDYATGYGLVDAEASLAIVDAGILGPGRRVLEGDAVSSTVADEYLIVVPPLQTRLRVTLAWDDVPGDELLPFDAPQLVNNLDLELISPANETRLPWTLPALSPNPNAATQPHLLDPVTAANIQPAVNTAVDDRNNVEQVEVVQVVPVDPLEDKLKGTWRVRVKGAKLQPSTSQEYSLVADYPLISTLAVPALPEPPPPGPSPAGPPGFEPTTDRCQELDWGRVQTGGFRFDFEGGACGYIPLEPVCRYIVNCSVCDRFGLCPATRIALSAVPEFFRVAVRRRDGTTVAAADASAAQIKTLSWQPVAGEEYGLFFETVRGARPAERHTIGIEVSTQAVEGPR